MAETEQVEEGRLKYLGFFQVAVLKATACLSSLYDYAKENSGPLKAGVETVEQTVKTVVGPVYYKIEGKPLQLLHYVDNKVNARIICQFIFTMGLCVDGSPGLSPNRIKGTLVICAPTDSDGSNDPIRMGVALRAVGGAGMLLPNNVNVGSGEVDADALVLPNSRFCNQRYRQHSRHGPSSTYTVNITPPDGVKVTVNPSTLSLCAVKEKKSYNVTFAVENFTTNSSHSFDQGFISWISSAHTVRSPISIFWSAN